jgi:hypothetical protein
VSADTPAWSVYRSDALPALSQPDPSAGRVIALAATDEAIERGWAPEIAIGLARAWSGTGAFVTLVDAALLAPALHQALSVDNKTGLSDALLFGSSFRGIAQLLESGRFRLVTAGSATADPDRTFQGERWQTLCRGAIREEVTLLVFVPLAAPWSAAVVEEATDIVVLAAAGDDAATTLRHDPRIRAILGIPLAVPDAEPSGGRGDPLAVDPLETMLSGGGRSDDLSPTDPADPLVGAAQAADLSSEDPATMHTDDPWVGVDAALKESTPDMPFVPLGAEAAPEIPVEDSRSEASVEDPLSEASVADAEPETAVADPLAEAAVQVPPAAVQPDDFSATLDAAFEHVTEPDAASAFEPIEEARLFEAGETVDALQASADRAQTPDRRWTAAGVGVALVVALVLFALRMMGQPDASATIAPDDPVVAQAPPVERSPMPPEAAPPPEAVGPIQRFTVALASYQDATAANARVEALTGANPGHLFISAPIVAGGTVYHRLLAGLAPDADAASRLSGVLSQAISESSANWIVRDAPLAFEMSRSPQLVVATERRDELHTLGLPAYVLRVEMSDGSAEYRVYVGAYLDETEALHLRGLLAEQGLADAPLVERRGDAVR